MAQYRRAARTLAHGGKLLRTKTRCNCPTHHYRLTHALHRPVHDQCTARARHHQLIYDPMCARPRPSSSFTSSTYSAFIYVVYRPHIFIYCSDPSCKNRNKRLPVCVQVPRHHHHHHLSCPMLFDCSLPLSSSSITFAVYNVYGSRWKYKL